MPYDRTAFITRTALEGVAFDFAAPGDGFLADKLFTPKPVDKALKKIGQVDTSKLRVALTEKATNSEPDLIDENIFYTNVTLEEHKLASEINPRDVRDADQPALVGDARKTKIVTLGLQLRREQKAVTLATTTGNYPSGLTSAIASGSRWNEAAGDPESDMVTANQALMNSCGMRANAIAIGDQTMDKIRLSPYFRDRTKYTNPGPIPDDLIKALFGVQYLFVGKARYDSAKEGATASVGGFWSDYAIAYVYNPSPSMEDVGYGLMALEKAPFWVDVFVDQRRTGAAGAMRRITVGSEYKLAPGFVESSSSSKFNAGYLFRTVVA
jgi:hypothetical protein